VTIAPVDDVARRVTVAEKMAPRYAANDAERRAACRRALEYLFD
jgi:hypothetical protein